MLSLMADGRLREPTNQSPDRIARAFAQNERKGKVNSP
jgi:hypothetical protein